MQGGKNWILPKEMKANRFFWESHWLEIWSNHLCPSMGPNGGSVAMVAMDFQFAASGIESGFSASQAGTLPKELSRQLVRLLFGTSIEPLKLTRYLVL
jgi:hypothetical protein